VLVAKADPKVSLAGVRVEPLLWIRRSLAAGTALAHRIAGLIRSLADSPRASSQSCRVVTASRAAPNIGTHTKENTMQPMLTGRVDYVMGVDTHRDTNTAAIVEAITGGVVDQTQCATDAMGYKRTYGFVTAHAPGRRVWALEGTGSYGAGLTRFLLERGEWFVEIDRPARPARRDGAKNDDLDAARAAREALSRVHLAAPRARGDREAIRVLLTTRQGAIVARTKAIGQLKALIVGAPDALREQLRRGTTDQQLDRCARLRTLPTHTVEHRYTVQAIRATARRALALEAEAAEHETHLEQLVMTACPELLQLPGVGPVTAAQFLISWSHSHRIRSEAAFASLAGETLLRNDVVLIDEIGFAPLDDTGAQLLFRLVAAAYERRALGVASHWSFEDWGRFLPEHTTTVSLLDRLLHHATTVVTSGQSHRMREAKTRIGGGTHTKS